MARPSEARAVLVARYPQHDYLNRSLRGGKWLSEHGLRRLSRGLDLANRIVFSADIPSRMALPDGAFFMHNGLGVVIDERVVLRGPVLVMQFTTIGFAVGGRDGVPTIGSHVVIGAGATVVGGITVGDNCLVGAGAVLSQDLPSGHRAVGNPATIKPVDPDRVLALWKP